MKEKYNNCEVLISTMNQVNGDFFLFDKMNISSDAIICNQSDFTGYMESKNEYRKRIFSYEEIGIGRSRNSLILRSNKEFCIVADDDLVFDDEYSITVNSVFNRLPDADVLIFSFPHDKFKKKKDKKINKFTFSKYGAARVVFKRKSIIRNRIFFDLEFGGGGKYGSGEDTIFLNECLDKGLKIYAVNETIARLVDDRPSTWFEGYNEKYWNDKGALFAAMGNPFTKINICQYAFRKAKLTGGKLKFIDVYKLMINGYFDYKKRNKL